MGKIDLTKWGFRFFVIGLLLKPFNMDWFWAFSILAEVAVILGFAKGGKKEIAMYAVIILVLEVIYLFN